MAVNQYVMPYGKENFCSGTSAAGGSGVRLCPERGGKVQWILELRYSGGRTDDKDGV